MHHPVIKRTIPLGSTAAASDPHLKDPAWAAWMRHVDAGRIGSTPPLDFDQRVKMMRNETALFGEVRTRALLEF